MPSNATRGAAAKARSKRWLECQGYTVFDMEKQYVVYTLRGMVPVKRDQLAADVGFLDLPNDRVVLVQVKSGAKSTNILLKAAQRAFSAYAFPKTAVRLELHVWRLRARAPEVLSICRP